MAITPALPIAGIGAPTAPVPFADDRVIPTWVNPAFGIPVNAIIPGVGPQANPFYNSGLQYAMEMTFPIPPANQTVDWYSAEIPGLMNLQNNAGNSV